MRSEQEIINRKTCLKEEYESLVEKHKLDIEDATKNDSKSNIIIITKFYQKRLTTLSDKIQMLEWVLRLNEQNNIVSNEN
jgi:hypothetical protein